MVEKPKLKDEHSKLVIKRNLEIDNHRRYKD